ncbi:MAG: signal peptide peptidase SppA [Crocinitomicaceae bacterium]
MFVVSILSMVIFFWIFFSGLNSMFESKPFKMKENTVLHLQLNQVLTDKTKGPEFNFGGMSEMGVGLIDMIDGIEQAKEDDKIEGIFLDLTDVNTGLASVSELRAALEDFKNSGKWVIAYGQGEYFSEKALYLASIADELYLFPTLVMEWNGIGVERMFFKGTLDKLGVKVQIIRGSNNDFKSAVEPFFLSEMSDSARHQTQVMIDNMWAQMVNQIGSSRNISVDSLNMYAENMTIRTALDASKLGFVDGLKYPDEVYDIMMKKAGVSELKDLHFLNASEYVFETLIKEEDDKEKKGDRIAVIMAEGGVTTGKGKEVHSTTIAKYIRKARLDDDVKGILLRVNSPGGSALASDIIWREVVLAKEVKPVYVSMGNVAASGGYYISCAADKIYATEGTITGSIGVFGMIPYTGDMMKDKLGVTSDFVTTHPHSVLSLNKKLTEEEFNIVQGEVDRIYDEFISRVSDGRSKLSKEDVNRIGRGRVWSGRDALRIGLVDEIGNYQKAKQDLLSKLELDNDAVEYFPKRKYPAFFRLKEVFSAFGGEDEDEEEDNVVQTSSWEQSAIYKAYSQLISELKTMDLTPGVKAQLPYTLEIR